MLTRISLVVGLGLLFASRASAADFAVEKFDDGLTVNVDGKLFTRYLTKSGAKPILWPVLGPTGKEMTRAWPMREGNPDEKTDHVHQRSLWFTHGSVNGVSFWDENPGHGTIEHREFLKFEGGKQGVVVTRNEWLGPDGKKICSDLRSLTFGADRDSRWIDFDLVVSAEFGEVVFGDTKEGSFGLRTVGTVDVDKKLGGQIVNSEGQKNEEAWGKPAAWVDYHGPIEGERLGIAILNHPDSFRYPTHWHVRTYGLFAANPFGLHDFYGTKDKDGSYVMPQGEKMKLHYRVLLHSGDEKAGHVSEQFAQYSQRKRP